VSRCLLTSAVVDETRCHPTMNELHRRHGVDLTRRSPRTETTNNQRLCSCCPTTLHSLPHHSQPPANITTTHSRLPTFLLAKYPRLSRTPMRNFPGPFRSPRMLKYKEKPLPCPPDHCPPFPSLPSEVGPFKSSYGVWGVLCALQERGLAEPQPKSNLVHFSLKI